LTDTGPSRFCTSCGAAAPAGTRFCASCGAAVDPGASNGAADGGTAAGGPPPRRGTPAWLWAAIAGGVVAVLLVAVVVVVARDDSGSDADVAAGEIFLEPAGSIGRDPFSDRNLEGPVASTVPAAAPTTLPAVAVGSTTVRAVAGDAVGLYGGTGSQSRCDREQMIAFLQANPSHASAFVAALDADPTLRWSGGTQVTVAQLPQYLRQLTPITLTHDTRVTNHGYRDGRPTTLQAVLQAGTAVMVDSYGVPRVRCACGNPLTPPTRVTTTPTYRGTPWTGWNPASVLVVTEVTVAVDVFVLIDLGTGTLVERPAGTDGRDDVPVPTAGTTATTARPPTSSTPSTAPGATVPSAAVPSTVPPDLGTGDIQATLTWTGDVDADLHVIDPEGFEISYAAKTSPSGGTLDFDKIPSGGEGGPHVENVFWPTGGAPRGSYDVWVRALSGTSSSSAPFTLTVSINGTPYRTIQGDLATGEDSEHITFTI
jgi:hypothetical protein